MRITADTNVLVRILVDDDAVQAEDARRLLQAAEWVAIPIPVFCELVWVLRRAYHFSSSEIAGAIARIADVGKVVTDRVAIESGLIFLRAGRDFADGAIARQGEDLGAEVFVTFDREAGEQWRRTGGLADEPTSLINR